MTPTEQVQNHVATIKAIINSYSLPSGAKVEIEAACEWIVKRARNWEEDDDDEDNCECSHDCVDEVESMPGHYVIIANGMIEQERVKKLIESLKYSPYEATLI